MHFIAVVQCSEKFLLVQNDKYFVAVVQCSMMHEVVGVLGRYSLNALTGIAMAGSYDALQICLVYD